MHLNIVCILYKIKNKTMKYHETPQLEVLDGASKDVQSPSFTLLLLLTQHNIMQYNDISYNTMQ